MASRLDDLASEPIFMDPDRTETFLRAARVILI